MREERATNQPDLADRAEISTQHLSTIENGKCNPSYEVVARIARAFGVPLSELVRRAERDG